MSIISNEHLPSYDAQDFRSFMTIVQKRWNLPSNFEQLAEFYFLRHWTAEEIHDNLEGDGITIEGITYIPLFKRNAISAYNRELARSTGKLFWLSFRAVRYPLGATSGPSYGLKCYVLIQEDTKQLEN